MAEAALRHRSGTARPILKWAGGKRQLLPALRPFYPVRFHRYYEPFVGSGAVFLDLHNAGALDGHDVHLSDINPDVIGCYLAVRDAPREVIGWLRKLEAAHAADGTEHFYRIRDGEFNPVRKRILQSRNPLAKYTPKLAAMLIYLNRTGYNGLFRVNASGGFNVPAGRYVRPRICDEENLTLWSLALQRPGLTLAVSSFDDAVGRVQADDFVYLDPPYAPLSATARFTAYHAAGFGQKDQERLQQTVIDLASRGASVLLSNSASPEIERLYGRDSPAHHAGLEARRVPARRAINSQGASRGPVDEYLITNVSGGPIAADGRLR